MIVIDEEQQCTHTPCAPSSNKMDWIGEPKRSKPSRSVFVIEYSVVLEVPPLCSRQTCICVNVFSRQIVLNEHFFVGQVWIRFFILNIIKSKECLAFPQRAAIVQGLLTYSCNNEFSKQIVCTAIKATSDI